MLKLITAVAVAVVGYYIKFEFNYELEEKKKFVGWEFGRPTFWQICTSVVNHEDMDSLFPFLTKWEVYII